MTEHGLVTQLKFTRSEFMRGLDGISAADGITRFEPMNCISWIVGHMADQENRYWVERAQGIHLLPELNALVGHGQPASTPPLQDMLAAWRQVTAAADVYLNILTPELLNSPVMAHEKPLPTNIGTQILRNIYHYWYHLGEAAAIRQMLGHKNLPEFVGNMEHWQYRVLE
ncbi:MAG TPA: DinB family protein [Anaerolineaceae bacterium]|nr:DinB family protein [Anaerolineaceae bacterium]